MSYKRKTEDEYRLFVNYGQGLEEVTAEKTRTEIHARRREYRINCPEYACKVTGPHRVKIELA